MKYIHNARINVFLKCQKSEISEHAQKQQFLTPEEYSGKPELQEKVKKVFHRLIPLDFEKEKVLMNEETVDSFENRKIKIYSIEISKEAHTNIFLKTLKELLGKDACKTLLEQKWSRLDDELFFYIRLDKEALLKDVVELTDSGDCFHIRMHIAAFPKNRESALKVVEEIFSA